MTDRWLNIPPDGQTWRDYECARLGITPDRHEELVAAVSNAAAIMNASSAAFYSFVTAMIQSGALEQMRQTMDELMTILSKIKLPETQSPPRRRYKSKKYRRTQ